VSNDPNVNPQHEPAEQPRPGRKWTAGVVALVVVFVALASYDLISGGVGSTGHPAASRTVAEATPRATPAALAGSASPAPSTSITSSPAASKTSSSAAGKISSPAASKISSPAPSDAAGLLKVADAAAYGPDGTSDGDHPELAPGIINGGDGQAWYTSWYASAEFGNLQSGTGLLLDMGETVTVSSLRLVLGAPVGADVQVRVGNTPLLAELPVAATASDVGGAVQLPATTPASGRYVLIWFTQLPLESTGKYQVSVYGATVYGTMRTLFAALGAPHQANTMQSVVIQLPYSHDDCGAWRSRYSAQD
jgi:hypothetical protein